jgi:hypothetical protein
VPPDVTVGLEEVAVGAEVEVPVFPVVPVVPESPESEVPADEELPPDVEDGVLVVVVRVAPAPGRSWATTMPMATVAPVAVTMAPRVRKRSRDLARSLAAGVLA